MKKLFKGKAWVCDVSMGYGHQRTAYPLKYLSPNKEIIHADDYENMPSEDKKIWQVNRKFYEFISNIERLPLIGKLSFELFDQFQKIVNLYPKNKEMPPTFILKQTFNFIKNGWGKHFIESLKSKNKELPFITTFFVPAFMAEYFRYPGKIACIICDTDISRSWVSINPFESRIIYFAPTTNVVERLLSYGVRPENIFLTGYPLPKENLGDYKNFSLLKKNLAQRLVNLDPQKRYQKKYDVLIKKYFKKLPLKSNHKLTIMFSIGGAGAQKEIALEAIKSLSYALENNTLNFIIACGTKEEIKQYFLTQLLKLRLGLNIDKNIFLIHHPVVQKYFELFNNYLNQTDILWTKPSELSFYAGLGIPIIIAPPLGSHEKMNKRWLIENGFGIEQRNPRFTNEWLFDLVRDGTLAQMAMEGFVEIKKDATKQIEQVIRFGNIK
jgi:UDP-N-acetylglucosamine:LPS N-acetylglucosamine transferase